MEDGEDKGRGCRVSVSAGKGNPEDGCDDWLVTSTKRKGNYVRDKLVSSCGCYVTLLLQKPLAKSYLHLVPQSQTKNCHQMYLDLKRF